MNSSFIFQRALQTGAFMNSSLQWLSMNYSWTEMKESSWIDVYIYACIIHGMFLFITMPWKSVPFHISMVFHELYLKMTLIFSYHAMNILLFSTWIFMEYSCIIPIKFRIITWLFMNNEITYTWIFQVIPAKI